MSGRVVLMCDPYDEPDWRDMKFTLTYEGVLLGASRTNTRAKHKHEIRKRFHPQLAHLWRSSPTLFHRREYPLMRQGLMAKPSSTPEEMNGIPWADYMASQYSRLGYQFVPLVVEELFLSCRLDILFLRWDPTGSLIRSGDIDNRLKTLFDAFRLPDSAAELGGFTQPDAGEDPFYVLLQDDKLITHISVETDVLHEPTSKTYDENDARLVIEVTIRPANVNLMNVDFV